VLTLHLQVRKVGPEVKYLRVGDRVLCCTDGSFSTTWSMSELFCAKIPDSLAFEEAATIPLVYGTVIAGLMDLAKLSKGQVGIMLVVEISSLLKAYLDCPHTFCLRWCWHSCYPNSQDDRS
jgi:threonine dehydrogenase-like Zn-dependent dehydrogenase